MDNIVNIVLGLLALLGVGLVVREWYVTRKHLFAFPACILLIALGQSFISAWNLVLPPLVFGYLLYLLFRQSIK